jgi:hypothetical protein
MADRKVYDYSRGKYGVLEGLRDLPVMPRLPEPRNLEAVTAVVLAAFGGGLVAAYILATVVLR